MNLYIYKYRKKICYIQYINNIYNFNFTLLTILTCNSIDITDTHARAHARTHARTYK
jgi:hypothetical protein